MKQLFTILIASSFILAACRSDPTPDMEATVQAAVGATLTAFPSDTPMPAPTQTPIPTATPSPPPSASPTPTPTSTATASPTSQPTVSAVTSTPTTTATASASVATEDVPLRVRGGPGIDYPTLDLLQPGTQLTLLARSADGEWYQIAYPVGSDERGWVIGEFLEIQGSPDQLPLAQAPPIPTPSALPTASGTSGSPTTTTAASASVATEDVALRVRGGPGTDFPTLGTLQPGTQLALLARSADGEWYQITYPVGSDERGWVIGEFLQISGSPDQLPLAQAPLTATPPPTPQAVEACAPIPNQAYGSLAITSAPTDRPAEIHADLNLSLRGYVPSGASRALIDLAGSTDPGAPQLRGLFGDQRQPTITGAYQVYGWDWGTNARGPLIGNPEATLLGLRTTTGEIIATPDGGGDLGQGYVVLVLYASPERITLKYTLDDNVVDGYTLHIENVCVEPTLMALYESLDGDGRIALPALRPGQPLGRATGSEIGVAVRDKGSFMDPRSRKDWW